MNRIKQLMKRSIKMMLILCLSFVTLTTNAQSIELDKALGEQNALMVEAQLGSYTDENKTEYIQTIGNRLLDHLPNKKFEYQFSIVPDMSPNAFALPGGYIYITTGLLPLIETEDELACILAHEIIHSHNRHSVKQLKKSILPKLLEVPGNLLGVVSKDLASVFNAPIETSNALLFASYGRKFETEADSEGIALAAAAGYNPMAMVSVLGRMSEAVEKATGNTETKSYFNDHPYTPDRLLTLQKTNTKIEWEPKKSSSNNFIMELDGLLFGESPDKGVIQESQFLHPDLNFAIQFPEKWDIENQPTHVGAYHPERNAAVYLSMENSKLSPEKAGTMFLAELDVEYKSKLTNSETYKVNGKEGYLVSFTETVKNTTMYAYVLWLPVNDKLFKITGVTPIEHKSKLEKTAKSLRPLNDKEKLSFKINLVRIVNAKQDETIKTISKRTDNVLNEELSAIINSVDMNQKLKEGQQIKVVKQYNYNNR